MKLNTNQIRHCMYISYRSNAIEHMTDLENVEHFAFDDVNGMIGIKNNILYIIFSGSDEPTNWINDFKFWKRPYRKIIPYSGVNPKIRVHHGFITSYKKSRNFVLNKAKDYEKVICTGHRCRFWRSTTPWYWAQSWRSFKPICCTRYPI